MKAIKNRLFLDYKNYIRSTLRQYHGTGILVSHDRELLDSRCSSIIFVEPPQIMLLSGNYSQATQQKQL